MQQTQTSSSLTWSPNSKDINSQDPVFSITLFVAAYTGEFPKKYCQLTKCLIKSPNLSSINLTTIIMPLLSAKYYWQNIDELNNPLFMAPNVGGS